MERNKIASDLMKMARTVLAGVNVGLDLGDPRDIGELAYKLNIQDLYKNFGRDVQAEADGTDYFDYTGTINVYTELSFDERSDESLRLQDKIDKVVGVWTSKREREGFKFDGPYWDESRMTKKLVLRIPVRKNPDEALAEMMSSGMAYSTWGSILERLQRFGGLSKKHDEMAGSMPISEFVKAAREVTLRNDKESKFIDQIIRMIKVGKKHGAKELRWG